MDKPAGLRPMRGGWWDVKVYHTPGMSEPLSRILAASLWGREHLLDWQQNRFFRRDHLRSVVELLLRDYQIEGK
jgi:hypothetical protein